MFAAGVCILFQMNGVFCLSVVVLFGVLSRPTQNGLTMLLSRHSGNLSRNEFTRNSSGSTQPQSSQLAEPLWIDPGIRNGISVRDLISS